MRRTRLGVPLLGEQFPTRGGRLLRAFGAIWLRLLGWRFVGAMPSMPQAVVIGAPHTSNWDAAIALPAVWALGVRLHVMATHNWFKPPVAGLLRWLGGIPVNQQAPGGVAGQLTAEFRRRDKFVLLVTPEGTRRQVKRWKRGFYFIARNAGVPIIPIRLDWREKTFGIGPPIQPGNDFDAERAGSQFVMSFSTQPLSKWIGSVCGCNLL